MEAGDETLAVPAHAAHSLAGHLASLRVVWFVANSGAEGLEVVPDLLIRTVAIAFKIVHRLCSQKIRIVELSAY
jgi:hypothetical protein